MLSFKDEDNRKMPFDAEKKATKLLSRIFEILKFFRFFEHFFILFSKNPPKFQNFQKKTEYIYS